MTSSPIPEKAPGSSASGKSPAAKPRTAVTRAGVIWVAVVTALLLLVLLIIFILSNQQAVDITFLGLAGEVPLGMALFISAVAGGILVAAAGGARIIQLRTRARRIRKRTAGG